MQGLGTNGDWNFLYQGKEYVDAFGYNSYDFHARGFDSNLGRFDGTDPVDNYGISNYAGMMNNPTAYIDPDGRNPIIIGFMIGMFASAVSNMIKGTMPNSIGQFLTPGIVGAVGGVFGALAPNPIVTSLGKNIAYGAFAGAVTGGVSDVLSGGNGRGALFGAVTGGIGAGISWNMANGALNAMLHNPETALAGGDPIYFGANFNEVRVVAKSNFTLWQEANQRRAMFLGAIATYGSENYSKQSDSPKYEHTGAVNHSYPEMMFMPLPKMGIFGTTTVSGVQANRLAGNAFRDEFADLLRKEGRDVVTEVYKSTPFGRRFIDIEVSINGRVLGGIETKVGNSRYIATQRAKDAWLKIANDYPVNIVRKR